VFVLSGKDQGVKITGAALVAKGQPPGDHALLEYGQGTLYTELSGVSRVLGGNTVWAGNDSVAVVTW